MYEIQLSECFREELKQSIWGAVSHKVLLGYASDLLSSGLPQSLSPPPSLFPGGPCQAAPFWVSEHGATTNTAGSWPQG